MKRLIAALLCLLSALSFLLTGCGAPKTSPAPGEGEALPPAREETAPEEAAPTPAVLTEAGGAWFSTVLEDYVEDTVLYSDDWFCEDAAAENPALALCSMQLVCAASDEGHGTALLEALGFSDVRAVHYSERSADACAFTCGEKTVLRDGVSCTLRAVLLQSAVYDETGWEQNFRVNDDLTSGAHRGYAAAAEQLLSSLPARADGNPVIWWLAGYSRGGAIVGLAAAALIDRGETVFACTFASPACTDDAVAGEDRYRAIHNYLCDDDPVPMAPVWGMARYGQGHSLSRFSPEQVLDAVAAQSEAARQRLGDTYDGTWPAGRDSDGTKSAIPLGDHLRAVVGALEQAVPTRADYSAPHTDPYALEGETGEIVWVPQDALVCLVGLVARPEGLSLDTSALLRTAVLAELERQLGEASGDDGLCAEAAGLRLQLADRLQREVNDPTVRREEIYGILTLLSPLLVNARPVLDAGKLPAFTEDTPLLALLPYAPGVTALLQRGSDLFFSHHSDTLIARLKLLAASGGD